MGNGNMDEHACNMWDNGLLTPHGERELPRVSVVRPSNRLLTSHGERERRSRNCKGSPAKSSNPSWGTGTAQTAAEAAGVLGLLTPHGERERAALGGWGRAGAALLTPHGEREHGCSV